MPDVVKALGEDFYLDERALDRAVTQHSSTNLIHHARQGPHLDTGYLRVNAPALGVEDLLARLLA